MLSRLALYLLAALAGASTVLAFAPHRLYWVMLLALAALVMLLQRWPQRAFGIGWSWGGPISLAVPHHSSRMRTIRAYEGVLVRLCIGLEATDDLIADLAAGGTLPFVEARPEVSYVFTVQRSPENTESKMVETMLRTLYCQFRSASGAVSPNR